MAQDIDVMFAGIAATLGLVDAYMAAPDGAPFGADVGVVEDEPPWVLISATVGESPRFAFTVGEWNRLRLQLIRFVDVNRTTEPGAREALRDLINYMADILEHAHGIERKIRGMLH